MNSVELGSCVRFNETLSVQIDGNKSLEKVRLKIQLRQSPEPEYRVLLSRTTLDDFNFVYCASISRSQYKELAQSSSLIVDFDGFLKHFIELLNERNSACPTRFHCTLLSDGALCRFEVVRVMGMQRVSLPLTLKRLGGDELVTYANGVIRNLLAKLNRLESSNEDLKRDAEEDRKHAEKEQQELEERHRQECDRMQDEVADMRKNVEDQRASCAEASRHADELEAEAEALQDELDVFAHKYGELQRDFDDVKAKLDDAEEDMALLEQVIKKLNTEKENFARENQILQEKLSATMRDTEKSRKTVAKLLKEQRSHQDLRTVDSPMKSCDDRKLNELAAELREKDDLVKQLTERQTTLVHQVDELTQRNNVLNEAKRLLEGELSQKENVIIDLDAKLSQNKRTIDLYRQRVNVNTTTTPPSLSSLLNSSPYLRGLSANASNLPPSAAPPSAGYVTPPSALAPRRQGENLSPMLARFALNR